jgi:catechol 2,3-dioxygenase-like lactoylglutathione lyase family enzyme
MKQQKVDMKLEVDVIAVSDVDRSKQFYQRLGWRLDADDAPLEGLRIVQFTPPVVLVESKPQLQLNHQSRK